MTSLRRVATGNPIGFNRHIMIDAIRRYGTLTVAALLAGLIGGHASEWLLTPRAVAGPLLSLADAPTVALLATVIAVALIGMLAIATARLVNSAVGLFVLGWGIAVMGMRTGTVPDVAFLLTAGGAISPLRIASESLLWAVLVAIVSMSIWRVGGPLEDIRHPNDRFHGMISAVRGPRALRGLLAAVLALPIVVLLARTTSSGQALGAAAVAGLAVGVFGRMWAPRSQPVHLAPLAIAVVALGQLIAGGGGVTAAAIVTGSVPRPLRIMPIELAGGIVVGVAMGLGWARSFVGTVDEEVESPAEPSAKPLRSARTA